MIYTDKTKKAMKLCFEAHKDQLDKSGVPYVFHPFHVAEQMSDEATTIVALLHDVVEDTDYTLEDIAAMGFGQDVVDALSLMTHDKKNTSGSINFTLLSDVGGIEINQTASKDEIYEALDFFREGM